MSQTVIDEASAGDATEALKRLAVLAESNHIGRATA
jgi:hypothetical protein